jgi:hypothetical protein
MFGFANPMIIFLSFAAPITEKDIDMLGSEWVALADIAKIPLYPVRVKENISLMLSADAPLFLGSKRVD